MSDSPTITQQYSFAVGEDSEDGAIEPAEESVETDLETWGADVDHRERDSRIEQPEASSFGVDDRKTVTRGDGGEQHALFADTEDDQQTLTGERAASQCLFESDDTPDEQEQDHDHDDEPDTASDEASPRAVATDGGRESEEDDDSDSDDSHGFAVGARVEDRDASDDDPNPAVVIALPDEPAYAREIPALDGKSVADVNPEYGASSPVATVAYADDLDTVLDVWREADPDVLAEICDEEEVRTYDFPTARLRQATMSDGGRGEDDDETEQTDENERVMVAIPRLKLAAVADYSEYERNAVERHAGEGPKTAELTQYVEECRSALSILDDTDANGHISRVVAAGAADELEQSAERHHGEVEQELRELVGVLRQALDEQPPSDGFEDDEPTDTDEQDDRDDTASDEPDESPDEDEDTTFDADAETVTEAWEGAFLSASWGYDQTNVELAQIVEVSGSGKTVLARKVGAERVGHGRTSKQLRPTATQYGDEFRLHVRSGGDGDPMFRGSYPLGSDGDMDDGPTRRGWFSPFDNDPENSIRATRTGFGH